LCFVFFIIEVSLRLFYPQIVVCKINYEWRTEDKDKVLPYVPKPNYKGRMILKDQFNVTFTTDSGGFRSLKDYTLEKPEDITRIVFIGDSFVFGWGVNDNEVFTHLLEQRLNQKVDEKVEVINAAVYGYDMGEYIEVFNRVLKYKPDFIFLGFCLENDYRFTMDYSPERLKAERITPVRFIRKKINELHLVALIRDRLYITFPKIRSIMLSLGINDKRDIFLKEYPESLQVLLNGVEKKLKEMNKIAYENGTDFIVLLIPLKEQIYCRDAINKFQDYDVERPNKVLADILYRNNIEYIDLLPGLLLESKESKSRLYYDTEPHWTKYGHEVIAEIVFNRYKHKIGYEL